MSTLSELRDAVRIESRTKGIDNLDPWIDRVINEMLLQYTQRGMVRALLNLAVDVDMSNATRVYFLPQAIAASSVLTTTGVNVSDGNIVTIGGVEYTFKTALTPTEGEVLIGADAEASLNNLRRAVNHSNTFGTNYYVAVANPYAVASTTGTTTQQIRARDTGVIGNTIAVSEVATTLSWTTTTGYLIGGVSEFLKTLRFIFTDTETTLTWQLSERKGLITPSRVTGKPSVYEVFNALQVALDPYLNIATADTLKVDYYGRPNVLVDDTDVFPAPDLEPTLIHDVVARIRQFHDSDQSAQLQMQQADKAFSDETQVST